MREARARERACARELERVRETDKRVRERDRHGYHNTRLHVATRGNQHVATCYSMLQHATKYRNIMQPMGARSQLKLAYVDLELRLDWQHTATHCNTLQHTATHCNTQYYTLQHVAARCSLQHTVLHCNMLQHAATSCNMLQHAATCCNILQHAAHAATDTWQISIEAFICTPWASAASCNDNTLRYTATHYSTLQDAPTRRNTLQHTAACCNG